MYLCRIYFRDKMYLHCWCVHIELPEDRKSLLEELIANGDVSDVWGVVVVEAVDVLHDTCAVSFDGRQDQEVLQVPGTQIMEKQMFNTLNRFMLCHLSNVSTRLNYRCSLKTELSRTIFSRSSMSSLGRSAVMKALTVTETSSGSWVSESAVCTTCRGWEEKLGLIFTFEALFAIITQNIYLKVNMKSNLGPFAMLSLVFLQTRWNNVPFLMRSPIPLIF